MVEISLNLETNNEHVHSKSGQIIKLKFVLESENCY